MFIRAKWLLLLIPFFFASDGFSQKIKEKNTLRISYYNLENLYDTLLSTTKADSNYTPAGKVKWNTEKYLVKIANSAVAIRSLHDSLGADLVGISGVENQEVVKDLLAHQALNPLQYKAVFSKGEKGANGLGMAFLYNPKKLTCQWDTSFLLVAQHKAWEAPEKEAMHARFLTRQKTPLDIILMDLPNTLSGSADNKQTYRINAAYGTLAYLRKYKLMESPNLIFLGTFGEEPSGIPIRGIFQAESPRSPHFKRASFVCIPHFPDSSLTGTYYKDRQPFLLDYTLLSKSLYSNLRGWQYLEESFTVHAPQWLKHPHPGIPEHPYNNFLRNEWIGGYSSHFPISFTLVYAKKRKKGN